eukprot:198262_1
MDNKFTYTVSGFIRQQSSHHGIEIPLVIDCLCLRYYLLPEALHIRSKTSNESKISIVTDTVCIVDGNDIMDMKDESITKYKWKYRINQLSPVGCMHIGFESTSKHAHHSFTIGIAKNWEPFAAKHNKTEPIGSNALKKGDIIEMIFDVQNTKIGFGVNGSENICMDWQYLSEYHLKEYKYKSVIRMYPGFGIELMEFSIEHKPHSHHNSFLSHAVQSIFVSALGLLLVNKLPSKCLKHA